MVKRLDDEIVERARELRAEGLGWHRVALALGKKSSEGLRRRLDPEYRAARNAGNNASRQRVGRSAPSGNYVSDARPPPEAIEDARRRASAPLTLSMILFGDPPPGRSELDRQRGFR